MERMVTLSLIAVGLLSGASAAAGHALQAVGPAIVAMLGCIVLRSTRT